MRVPHTDVLDGVVNDFCISDVFHVLIPDTN